MHLTMDYNCIIQAKSQLNFTARSHDCRIGVIFLLFWLSLELFDWPSIHNRQYLLLSL